MRKGVVIFLHGFGDHQGTSPHLVQALSLRGYLVVGYDARGHGQSPGRRGDILSFDEYLQDLSCFFRLIREHYPDAPALFLMGYDLGGLVALRFAQQEPPPMLDGLVALSPLLHLRLPSKPLQGLWKPLHHKLLPTWRQRLPAEIDDLSHDLEWIELRQRDPLFFREITQRALCAIQNAAMQALLQAPRMRRPLLLLQAGEDRLTDKQTLERLAERIPSERLRLILYPGYLHTLHSETPDRRGPVFEDLLSWLDEKRPL
jgi:alpha-beta hydrolase superfamily lysophospholipase